MNTSKSLILFTAFLITSALTTHTASAQEIAKKIDITAFGGWAHLSGDRNMDTNSNDRVPACCTSRLYFSPSQILLDLHFYCEELEGDKTRFEGNRTLTLYTAPGNQRITALRFGNGSASLPTVYTFHSISQGENHYTRSFRTPIAGTYWDKLLYRVDSASDIDSSYVGVSGTVAFKVTLASK